MCIDDAPRMRHSVIAVTVGETTNIFLQYIRSVAKTAGPNAIIITIIIIIIIIISLSSR